MAPRLLAAILVVVCAVPAFAGRREQARLCKQNCGTTIQSCVDGGGRPRKCKRQVLRRCRVDGITVCVPPGTYHVASSGSDVVGCGALDAPCATIQFVVDELIPVGGAATIKVAAGTFGDVRSCQQLGALPNQAVVCIVNRHVRLLGGFVPPSWDSPTSDPGATVIDVGGQGRGVRVARNGPNEPTASLEMDNFTIRNGRVEGLSSGDLTDTSAGGGGMFVENTALTLRNMVFRDNEAIGGTTSNSEGGRAAGGGLAINDYGWPGSGASAWLVNVTFLANHARGGGGRDMGGYSHGGALFTYGSVVSGSTLFFIDNTATAGDTDGNGFSGSDKADALGGAVSVELNSTVDLRHVHATGNVARGGAAADGEAGSAFGGAFFSEVATLTISDAVIVGNRAEGGDGHNDRTTSSIAQGGGVFATMGTLTLDRAIVVGNEARAGDGARHGGIPEGGGVAVTIAVRDGVDTPFTIRNSVIANNAVTIGSGAFVGGGGAGVFLQGASGTLEHVTIANNRLGDPRLLGGGMTMFALPGMPTEATILNGILANHTTPASQPSCYADAALWLAQNTSATVTRVLFANNVHDTNAGTSGGCNVWPGTVNTSGVLGAPQAGFASAGSPADDYHLVGASPAVGQASGGSVAMDLDGNARPSGGASDLGAYEFMP